MTQTYTDDTAEIHDGPECPECGDIGDYRGTGRTSASNWHGTTFAVRYCENCEYRYRTDASHLDSPTM